MCDVDRSLPHFQSSSFLQKTILITGDASINTQTLPIIILNGRPGAGKSEIIDYITGCSPVARIQRFHIDRFDVFDDFPILWSWFEEDDILESMGYPRLHSDNGGYFKGHHLWELLIKRLNQEYGKTLRDKPLYHESHTAVIEFSRGSEHGGYAEAYQSLSEDILSKAAIMYINVSWEESKRKNRARFNPNKPDSILEHGLDEIKMEKLYRDDDWMSLVGNSNGFLNIQGYDVPYTVFENDDDVTTGRGTALGARLEQTLNTLWQRYQVLHHSVSSITVK